MLNASFGGLDANPDQVVEIAVGQPFDIQKDGSAFEFWVRNADGVDLVLADCKRPQGMMIFLLLASRLPAATTRTKCVGQLSDREDALAVEPLALFLRYAGQQTEFVLFPRLRAASSLELALAAMSVQHKVRRRIAGQECGDLFDPFSHLTGEGRYLHLQRGVAVAMHDLAQSLPRVQALRTARAHRTRAAACVLLQVCWRIRNDKG